MYIKYAKGYVVNSVYIKLLLLLLASPVRLQHQGCMACYVYNNGVHFLCKC